MIKLELKNINFSYQIGLDSYVQVLNNLFFEAKTGEIIGLIGKNGSGKSTLLNLLKGELIPQKGTKNIIFENGKTFPNTDYIPLVSQTVDSNLFPSLTVYENYCLIKSKKEPTFRLFNSLSNYQYCKELLRKADMDIDIKINEQIRFLSGGQKQAISILFALEQDYPILLMDEPTASLDPFVSKNIIELAKTEITKRNGILILVSHNLQDIIKYTTKIIILSEGQIKELPSVKNINEIELMKLM